MRRGLAQRRAEGPEATIAGEEAAAGCEEKKGGEGRRAGGCFAAKHMDTSPCG